jgi:hypothetical protein
MKKIILSTIGLIFLGSSQILYGQSESGVIQCDSYSLSRPLSELIAEEQANIKKNEKRAQKTRLKDLESKDKKHREPQKFIYSEEKDGAAYGTDPALIQSVDGTRPGPGQRLNINGLNSNSAPHDPSGAAGLTYYIQATNATPCRIINKATGATVSNFTMGTLWNPDLTQNSGDPIVMYDRYANRWFLAQFGTSGNKIYIAVSTTSDPQGTWSCYSFTSPAFPDYLKFSIWQDGYYMTSNQSSQKVFAFERTAMLAGSPTARSVYATFNPPDGGGFFCPLPADADGNGGLPAAGTACPIMSYSDNAWGGGVIDGIQIYQMAVNWAPATPTAAITFVSAVPTMAFDGSYNASWNDIAQPGTTQKLDGIGGVLMYRAQYRKGATHNTVCLSWPVKISATQRSIMWAELRQNLGTGAWSVYQQQIYAPDTYYRWMGSISMDDAGNIGLCYAKSGSSTVFPSLAYTGRLATDPINTMTLSETIAVAGTVSQNTSWYGGNRFGDYAHTTLDPDGSTYWHTGEYLGGSAADPKKTRVYSFAISLPSAANVSVTSSDADNTICTGSSVTFTAVPTNGGTAPSYQWYINGNPVGTNSTTFTTSGLTTGQIVTCIMTSNMPGVTSNPATSNGVTTTVTAPVTPTVSIIGSTTICAGTLASFVASAGNTGATPSYQWTVNGSNVGTSSTSYSYIPTSGDIIGVTLTSSNTCVTSSTAVANPLTMVVNPSPAAATISQNANVLTSNSSTGNQWYLNGNLIAGATSQNYTATQNGTYTVVVTSGGCSSAASAGSIINGIAAIVELDPYVFSIFPNPSQGDFSVSFKANLDETYKLKVFNEAGQLVYEDAIDNQNGQIVKAVQLGKVASGIYNVTLSNGQIESSKKIIVKKD